MSIRLLEVDKAFGSRAVLQKLTAEFAPGSITAVTGPSGCGKTTLLRILAGLEQPDAGVVEGAAQRVAMTFQEDRLVAGVSAIANLQLVCGLSREEIENELAALSIDRAAAAMPAGRLSGGQKRRVALLRALLAPSELLLLDEPFSGLDGETRALAARRVAALRAGRTLLFVTHEPQDAAALNAQVLALG